MLCKLDKIDPDDIVLCGAQFDILDIDASGQLNAADILELDSDTIQKRQRRATEQFLDPKNTTAPMPDSTDC
eukprot:m.213085 g.213085  ORF g.213085 m.213085 type:complete len:72 (+) comp26166_c0_seq1:1027-1242(+)